MNLLCLWKPTIDTYLPNLSEYITFEKGESKNVDFFRVQRSSSVPLGIAFKRLMCIIIRILQCCKGQMKR